MKRFITLNGSLTVAAFMLLTLWAGYAIGYRRGTEDNQNLWWSSAKLEGGRLVFLGPSAVAVHHAPSLANQNAVPDRFGK